MDTQFNWDKHYKARVVQAGGNPDERLESTEFSSVPRYSMSDNGCIWDGSTDEMLLDSFEVEPTKL